VTQVKLLLLGAHGHPKTEPCGRCLPLLAEAAALYRGDFMKGFGLRDAPAFQEWQFFQAESLRREQAGVLERLARAQGERREFELAIGYARRWLALDPLNEAAHRQLMQLYAASGQRSAALRQYQDAARVLEAELGGAPLPETTALHEHLQAGERPAPLPTAPRHNLPAQLSSFVGRERARRGGTGPGDGHADEFAARQVGLNHAGWSVWVKHNNHGPARGVGYHSGGTRWLGGRLIKVPSQHISMGIGGPQHFPIRGWGAAWQSR
jgi:hypothetical protein